MSNLKIDRALVATINDRLSRGLTCTVILNKEMEKTEAQGDAGMKVNVVRAAIIDYDGDESIDLTFDYSPFMEHNERFMRHNYYDKYGTPCLTAQEAGYWKDTESWGWADGDRAPFDFIA